jgi:hypothetical protein
LELNGDDLRPLPFSKRKARLARLLARAAAGLAFNEHIEADGAAVFQHACKMGLKASCRSGSTSRIAPGLASPEIRRPKVVR